MNTNKQLVSSDQAVIGKVQHKKPCADCPWARTAINGWLGSLSPEEWLAVAHGEAMVECHTLLTKQCAGLATYRSNMCKSPRDARIMTLPADRDKVFATPMEFLEHHKRRPS